MAYTFDRVGKFRYRGKKVMGSWLIQWYDEGVGRWVTGIPAATSFTEDEITRRITHKEHIEQQDAAWGAGKDRIPTGWPED